MPSQSYNWKRFWCPTTGSFNLSDGGYLYDPDSEWGHIYNPDLVPFESIADAPCLALLGEPGIGKTHTMQTEQKFIDTKIETEGAQTFWLNLRSYGSEDRLVRDLFESTTFVSWTKGDHQLHVFLDSLDECLLRIDNVAALLIDEFKKYSVERLYLRISCRTAEWPKSFEDGLRQLWGNDAVNVYELTPLRRVDIAEAARVNGLDSDAFLHEIDRMEVVPFAIKPVTLEFLLNTYRRTDQLLPTQAELYLQGCQLLCEETSESRRDAGLIGAFTAEQRMHVAARIATVTVFANRYAIWTDVDRGDVPEEDITIQELCSGRERVNGDEFQVSEDAVRETLATGLFSSRGPNRMGWAHQTYAEFLSAWYLLEHEMTLPQIMSLIVHPGDPDGKLVSQLHEPSAWLAGMVHDVFREIMRSDPEVLLRSDVATADVKDRAALVKALLELYDEGKSLDLDWGIHKRYRKLAYLGLVEQLRPYICNRTKGLIVRRVAINIAEACKLQTLQNDLASIALDPSDSHPVREQAAYAVGRIGDEKTKAKLKPLAMGEAGDDPDDQLKGCGLQAVWPTHITTEELFAVLTPPKREHLIGAYRMFLSDGLVQHLNPPGLPTALKWIEEQGQREMLPYPFEKVMDAVMLKAWENLEAPGVLQVFARVAFSRLEHHDEIVGGHPDPPFESMLGSDDEKRHRLLETMLPLLSDPEKDWIWLVYSRTPIVISKDVPWLIARLQATSSDRDKRMLAHLVSGAFNWRGSDQVNAVLLACEDNPILAEVCAWILTPVKLNSPEAQKMKENYLESQKWRDRDKNRPLLKPPPKERISALLDECESGNSAAWWRLNVNIMLEPDGTDYGRELESDLTTLPGWKAAETATRVRIVEAAKRYVLEQDPETHKWLGRNTLYRPAFAGYRALRLLLQKTPDFLSTIPAEVWKKWAPIILVYPTSGSIEDEGPRQELVKMAYQYAAAEIVDSLMIMIDQENREHGRAFITGKVKDCWDDRLANALLDKVKENGLRPECMADLLSDLLDHKVDDARAFAESLVPFPPPSSGEERSRAIVAARVLMTHAEDAGWSIVWPAIQQDARFGQEVVKAVSHYDGLKADVAQRLTEDQLADLYVWLVRQYPYPEDEGAQFVGTGESVTMWRDFILRHLKERGTPQTCEAIRRIASELPELDWLKWTLFEAQNITRRHTWMPLRPSDILELARNQQERLVQSGDKLLDVLIETLRGLEADLQGETPASRDIWDRVEKNTYRPIDENALSDYAKRYLDEHLKEKGVIVNREVRIHRGERTDIHVEAVVQGPDEERYDSVTTIIEVKGCWNRGLNHAMKTQLVDRYLKDNRCQRGLYLIGWFNCNQWDDNDDRKRRTPELSISEAQKQFEAQAAELSQRGMRIKALVINTALNW